MAIIVTIVMLASSMHGAQALSLNLCTVGSCLEDTIAETEDFLAEEMQVELLQRYHEAGPDEEGQGSAFSMERVQQPQQQQQQRQQQQQQQQQQVTAKAAKEGCLEDALIGAWKAEDAFGLKGVVVSLDLERSADSSACSLAAKLGSGGQALEYMVSVIRSDPDKLHIKYYNWKAQPPYFHEGEYSIATNSLTQDVSRINGQAQAASAGTEQLLRFVREPSEPMPV